jgi:hypothetical protein
MSENRGIMLCDDARPPVRARDIRLRSVQLQVENLFLRHQLNIALRRALPRRRLRGSDRALLVWMVRLGRPHQQPQPLRSAAVRRGLRPL